MATHDAPQSANSTLDDLQTTDLIQLLKGTVDDLAMLARQTIEKAIRAGEILLVLRGRVAHGEWEPTLHKCGISKTQAHRCRRLAENSKVIRAALAQRPELTLQEIEEALRPFIQKVKADSRGDFDDLDDKAALLVKQIAENPKKKPRPEPRHPFSALLADLSNVLETLEEAAADAPMDEDVQRAIKLLTRKSQLILMVADTKAMDEFVGA
jgi:hypothetical protein